MAMLVHRACNMPDGSMIHGACCFPHLPRSRTVPAERHDQREYECRPRRRTPHVRDAAGAAPNLGAIHPGPLCPQPYRFRWLPAAPRNANVGPPNTAFRNHAFFLYVERVSLCSTERRLNEYGTDRIRIRIRTYYRLFGIASLHHC
jgi:hypothetical protein